MYENEFKQIDEMDNKSMELRKKSILKKIEVMVDYVGVSMYEEVFDNLKECTTFKHGTVLDFDKFKKDFLVSFEDLEKFNEFYFNTALGKDEVLYLGFDGKLEVFEDKKIDEVFERVFMEYYFAIYQLNSFEDLINESFIHMRAECEN